MKFFCQKNEEYIDPFKNIIKITFERLMTTWKRLGNPPKYKYNVTKLLGEGSFGMVYQGKGPNGQCVAIKKIGKDINIDNSYHNNALREEVRIFRYLKSEYIIQFINVIESQANIYMVMEYADGGTLHSILANRKEIDEKTVINYLMQIVAGMGVLFKNGIIHRDLKPLNILVSGGKLKISDFGYARFSSPSQKFKTKVGTEVYMAPQILKHDPYTNKCDIWSLGVIAYQMITGKLPWKIEKAGLGSHLAMVKKIVTDGLSFPEDCPVSKNLESFIKQCLVYEQKNRLDWKGVLIHPVFKSKFMKQVFEPEKISPKCALFKLRQSIHMNNINLQVALKDFPDELSAEDIITIVSAIDQEVSEDEVRHLFNQMAKKNTVTKDDLKEVFRDHKIKLVGMTLEQINKKGAPENKIILKLMKELSNKIQEKKMNLIDLYEEKKLRTEDALQPDQFNEILLKIDPDLPQEHLPDLMRFFDLNKDGKISWDELYSQFCKIGQVIEIKDRNIINSFKKIIESKRMAARVNLITTK